MSGDRPLRQTKPCSLDPMPRWQYAGGLPEHLERSAARFMAEAAVWSGGYARLLRDRASSEARLAERCRP